MWYFFSFILGVFAFIGLIIFWLLFGCAYEFIYCWMKKSFKFLIWGESEDLENLNEDINNENDNIKKSYTKKEILTISLLIFLGLLCQPIYLTIYLIYFILELCRNVNFCFFHID